jgi:predicted lysophospholipase L1 biosynthesis ABC-type transport system permease subunit
VPAVVTPEVLSALSIQVGQTTPLSLPGRSVPIVVVGVAEALPTTDGTSPALLLDLPSATTRMLHEAGVTRPISEWWISTAPAQHAAAATAAGQLRGATVVDRRALADAAAQNPYRLGARSGLLAAALGAVLLAVLGIGVEVWATARRRVGELAVLNTLGAAPRLLARALMAEQGFLAGIGVAVGLIVGAGVGATMAPLVILTPSAGRPVPEPAFELPWGPVGATAATLLVVSLALSSLTATTIRKRVAAAQLRIGADR